MMSYQLDENIAALILSLPQFARIISPTCRDTCHYRAAKDLQIVVAFRIFAIVERCS
jgi:hypothetical protein